MTADSRTRSTIGFVLASSGKILCAAGTIGAFIASFTTLWLNIAVLPEDLYVHPPARNSVNEPNSQSKVVLYNKYDLLVKEGLWKAAHLTNEVKDINSAVKLYNRLLEESPNSVQAHYGLALAICKLAETRQSNKLLIKGIQLLAKALRCPDIPDDLYIEIGSLRADHLIFLGKTSDAIAQREELVMKYPNNVQLLNSLGTAHCVNERVKESQAKAKEIFQQVLQLDPENSHAQAHLGFILAVYEKNPYEAAPLFLRALAGNDEHVLNDARFYYHAGDSLYRSEQKDKAVKIFQEGARRKIFLSAMQRSTYNVEGLVGRPWWELSQFPQNYQYHFNKLKDHWREIRDEGLALIDLKTKAFTPEAENLRASGEWKQFTLFRRGIEDKNACMKAPKTCNLIRSFSDAAKNKRGQVKFSLLLPGTKVWPHTGPTNCRLRPHLGLKIPAGAGIMVAQETRSWKEGEFIILDDSFEHEVWHNGTELRLILIVDVWHPGLTAGQKDTLTPM